jgi:5'-3' exonuclease
MATERTKEYREWATLVISLLTLLAFPAGALILRNQRLEIREENRKEYVSRELYNADAIVKAAESAQLKSEIATLNAKMDALKITMVRLTDAVKLSNP